MTIFFSNKIKIISLLCIVLVLYIHSGFHDYPNEIMGMTFNHYLQNFISHIIGICAVPLFFAISGYLFFLNIDEGISSIFRKMRKRIKTLIIPFVIAAIFYPVVFLLMEYLPFTDQFINGNESYSNYFQLPLKNILLSLFYNPLAFQLWFLRDLILIVAITPILFFIRKYIEGWVLILLVFISNYIPQDIIPTYALFWFLFGSQYLDKLSKLNASKIYITFFILCIIELFYPANLWKYIQIPVILLGVISIWKIYDKIVPQKFVLKQNKILETICSFTFFIYLFHEPTINIVRKIIVLLVGKTSFGFALTYLLSPWIFLFIFIGIGYQFKKYMPRIYEICTGGR